MTGRPRPRCGEIAAAVTPRVTAHERQEKPVDAPRHGRCNSGPGMNPWKLSLAIVATLAARAHANVSNPPPITAGPDCSAPATLSPDGKTGTCADPAYLQCSQSQKDACTTLFDQSFRSYVASSPSKKVILPQAMPHPQGTPGTLYDAAVVPTAPIQVTGQLGPVFESTLRATATAAQI